MQRPDIHRLAAILGIRVLGEQLGRRKHGNHRRATCHQLVGRAQGAEVDELHAALWAGLEHHVAQAQVAVADAIRMHRRDRADELLQDLPGLLRAASIRLHVLVQRKAVHILDHVHDALRVKDLVETANVLVLDARVEQR